MLYDNINVDLLRCGDHGVAECPCSWELNNKVFGGGGGERGKFFYSVLLISYHSTEHNASNGRCPNHFQLILSGIGSLLCLKSCLSTECLFSL